MAGCLAGALVALPVLDVLLNAVLPELMSAVLAAVLPVLLSLMALTGLARVLSAHTS